MIYMIKLQIQKKKKIKSELNWNLKKIKILDNNNKFYNPKQQLIIK